VLSTLPYSDGLCTVYLYTIKSVTRRSGLHTGYLNLFTIKLMTRRFDGNQQVHQKWLIKAWQKKHPANIFNIQLIEHTGHIDKCMNPIKPTQSSVAM